MLSQVCDAPNDCYAFGSIATAKLTCDSSRVGAEIQWPIYISPTCSNILYANVTGPHGECAVNEQLGAMGVYSVQATCGKILDGVILTIINSQKILFQRD